jgi:DNA-directed RNA polymerase specialized sigma24 family protein
MGRNEDRDYEKRVDQILRQMKAARDPEYPAHAESDLARADRRRAGEVSLEELYERTVGSIKSIKDLSEVLWAEIRSGARHVGCSDRQVYILEKRFKDGLSYLQISQYTECSISTIQRDLKDAIPRISKIPAFGLWTVLSEVFQLGINRIRDMLLHQ